MAMTFHFQFGVSQFTTNPWAFERDVETYARLGVSAIEVCEAKLDPAKISEQMARVKDAGLEITSVQPVTRTLFPSLSQPEPTDIGERMARFQQTIETSGTVRAGRGVCDQHGHSTGREHAGKFWTRRRLSTRSWRGLRRTTGSKSLWSR